MKNVPVKPLLPWWGLTPKTPVLILGDILKCAVDQFEQEESRIGFLVQAELAIHEIRRRYWWAGRVVFQICCLSSYFSYGSKGPMHMGA